MDYNTLYNKTCYITKIMVIRILPNGLKELFSNDEISLVINLRNVKEQIN